MWRHVEACGDSSTIIGTCGGVKDTLLSGVVIPHSRTTLVVGACQKVAVEAQDKVITTLAGLVDSIGDVRTGGDTLSDGWLTTDWDS